MDKYTKNMLIQEYKKIIDNLEYQLKKYREKLRKIKNEKISS